MVTSLFERLPDEKRKRIEKALLTEFSSHPLTQAQVARIVKEAGIARGAFYQYFDDLEDAYRHLFQNALKTLHAKLPTGPADFSAVLASTRDFLEDAQSSPYRDLIRLHFSANEAALAPHPSRNVEDPRKWAAMVLSHTTIHDVLLEPASLDERLAQLEAALNALKEG